MSIIILVLVLLFLRTIFGGMAATCLFAGLAILLFAPVGEIGGAILSLALIFGLGFSEEGRANRPPDPQRWINLGLPATFGTVCLYLFFYFQALSTASPMNNPLWLVFGFVAAFSWGAYLRGRQMINSSRADSN